MSLLGRGLALLTVLTVPMTGSAHGLGLRTHAAPVYYYAAPVAAVPVVSVLGPAVCPAYVAPPAAFGLPPTAAPAPAATTTLPFAPAVPTPAPPSAAPAPPAPAAKSPTPHVSESRNFFSAYAVVPRTTDKPAGDRCSVAFWNLAARDLSVKVNGEAKLIPRGKSVTLDLAREFVWQADGHDPQTERMPENETALEIVIRD